MFYRILTIIGVLMLSWVFTISANSAEIEISELSASVKWAIIEAQKNAAPPYMNIPWVEVEVSYIVRKEAGGGFKMYVVTADGKYATEAIQRIKFRLQPAKGDQWKTENPGEFKDAFISGIDHSARKVFISPAWNKTEILFSVEVNSETKITDATGKKKTLSEVKEGTHGTISYRHGPEGKLKATAITILPPKNVINE